MTPSMRSFVRSFNRLEEPVRQHLKNVYSCLMLSTLSACAGGYFHIYTEFLNAGTFTVFASLASLIALMVTPDNGKNVKLRMGYLLTFAFFGGLGLGPVLELLIAVDPRIIVTSFFGTCIIFSSFTLSAILARKGYWLYLGSVILTLTGVLGMMALTNILLKSYFVIQAHLYLGLFLMCIFVLYDTQLIIEKRRNGDRDFVGHSVDLFIDFVGMFRRILSILARQEHRREG